MLSSIAKPCCTQTCGTRSCLWFQGLNSKHDPRLSEEGSRNEGKPEYQPSIHAERRKYLEM